VSKVGYARVSTRTQSDDSQIDELRAAGCDKIFTDRGVSGKLARRPQWDACKEYLRPGDTLVITRLSRAMRSLKELLNVADELKERGIGLKVLKQDLDTTTPHGMLVFQVLGAVDQFTRDLIVEGTKEGLAAARARGKVGGRKAKLSPEQVQHARQLYDARQHTVQQIADLLGVDRRTVYRSLERDEKRQNAPTATETG
jgi:DNA invertase Pin-like site-specific DNA recombinase